MINLQNLLDDAKCDETVRQLRWPDGVRCPHCGAAVITSEYARDEDGDGFHEIHINTIEGFWSLLRSWLRPHRGSRKKNCRSTWASFSSCTTLAFGAKACLGPSWNCWSHSATNCLESTLSLFASTG